MIDQKKQRKGLNPNKIKRKCFFMETRAYGQKLVEIRNSYIQSKAQIEKDSTRTAEGKALALSVLRDITKKDLLKVEAEMKAAAEEVRAGIPAAPKLAEITAEQDMQERRAAEILVSEILSGTRYDDALAKIESVVNSGTVSEKFGLLRIWPLIQEKLVDKYGGGAIVEPARSSNPWAEKSEPVIQDREKLIARSQINGKMQFLFPQLQAALKTKNQLAFEASKAAAENIIDEITNHFSVMRHATDRDFADLHGMGNPWDNPPVKDPKNPWG